MPGSRAKKRTHEHDEDSVVLPGKKKNTQSQTDDTETETTDTEYEDDGKSTEQSLVASIIGLPEVVDHQRLGEQRSEEEEEEEEEEKYSKSEEEHEPAAIDEAIMLLPKIGDNARKRKRSDQLTSEKRKTVRFATKSRKAKKKLKRAKFVADDDVAQIRDLPGPSGTQRKTKKRALQDTWDEDPETAIRKTVKLKKRKKVGKRKALKRGPQDTWEEDPETAIRKIIKPKRTKTKNKNEKGQTRKRAPAQDTYEEDVETAKKPKSPGKKKEKKKRIAANFDE